MQPWIESTYRTALVFGLSILVFPAGSQASEFVLKKHVIGHLDGLFWYETMTTHN